MINNKEQFPKEIGVYKISNSIDDRVYIGGSKNLYARRMNHKTKLRNIIILIYNHL